MKKIVLTVSLVLCTLCFASCGIFAENIEWINIALCDIIPEPPSNLMDISKNNEECFDAEIYEVSENDFHEYIRLCKDKKGFNIDDDSGSDWFHGYNSKGYYLRLSYDNFANRMSISLDTPIILEPYELESIAYSLPKPNSNLGSYYYQYEHSFLLYVGNTTKDDYDKYIDRCIEAGFDINMYRGDILFWADNAEGCNVSISYKGFNTMSIHFDVPFDYFPNENDNNLTETEKSHNDNISDTDEKSNDNDESSKILTVETCPDLAKLLSLVDPADDFVSYFAEKYKGQTIEFDGCIWAMDYHGSYKTRYDILIGAGDFDENKMRGPYFQLSDVNSYDMGLDTLWPEDVLSVETNIVITAKVGDYNPNNELFQLDVLKIEVRD